MFKFFRKSTSTKAPLEYTVYIINKRGEEWSITFTDRDEALHYARCLEKCAIPNGYTIYCKF